MGRSKQGYAATAHPESYAPFRPGRTRIKRSLTEALAKCEPLTCGTAAANTREFTKPYVRGNRAACFTQEDLLSMIAFDREVDLIMNRIDITMWRKQELVELAVLKYTK